MTACPSGAETAAVISLPRALAETPTCMLAVEPTITDEGRLVILEHRGGGVGVCVCVCVCVTADEEGSWSAT
jgi:hypothetical protein